MSSTLDQPHTTEQERPTRPAPAPGTPVRGTPALGTPAPVTPAPVTPAQTVLLQSFRAYPSVSLLLTTTPAPAMRAEDRDHLDALLNQALARLRGESLLGVESTVVRALQSQVAHAYAGPTDAAVAVFASQAWSSTVHLSVPVVDRVVIDPTFATRDLVRSVQHTPRHVVLVLHPHQATLYDGVAATLRPALRSPFPLHPDRDDMPWGTATQAYLARVDRGLGTYLRLHPAPLILAGDPTLLDQLRGTSRNTRRLAGILPTEPTAIAAHELPQRISPLLTAYLRSREAEALQLLDERARAGRVVAGIQDAWSAARRGTPEMLAVETGHFYPARLSAAGDRLEPATDVDHPDVLDDAVDELIELVLDRGGWIALVHDGTLHPYGRIALTMRD